jgi:hypothetical protein
MAGLAVAAATHRVPSKTPRWRVVRCAQFSRPFCATIVAAASRKLYGTPYMPNYTGVSHGQTSYRPPFIHISSRCSWFITPTEEFHEIVRIAAATSEMWERPLTEQEIEEVQRIEEPMRA